MVEVEAVIEDHEKLQMEAVTRVYRERHSILTLMRQLNRLVNAIQRHRGVSLAHLAGDGLFMEDVNQVQAQVNKRLLVLRNTCDQFDHLVSPREQENIQHGWNTVCHNWEGDALLENFEYHSFLIEQLLQMSVRLANRLEEPLMSASGLSATVEPANPVHSELILPLVCRNVPELIEQLARIRGLATHAAVVGDCDAEHDKKLQYWLQCAERQNRELIHQIDGIRHEIKNSWKTLTELKNYELKLAFFLNTISKDIIHGDCAKADARQLFVLGSEIIEAYVDAVDGGISLLQTGLEKELEGWLVQL
ncbi:hypothetical protein G8770_05700 [Aestuariicella hydrocarbonica]|uniref:Uncharacterized protein n=1 Tax=Pseudomaricurvus hydrocarbonicus TaxID=1470433 RepID=A0A9E5MLN5_9GAMM|nr:hypothetical protein [Aestuariicella hydrocarbonica]NHO65033.1 hypothetical protein [Aestuariicella hydrocarbonica]